MISLKINKVRPLLILVILGCVVLQSQFALASDKYGGGSSGSGSSGSSGKTSASYTKSYSSAQSSAKGYTSMAQSYGKSYSYSAVTTYSSSAGWGYTVQKNEPYKSDGGGGGYNPSNPGPTAPSCAQAPDIKTEAILFVRTGTHTGSARPAARLLVDSANLQAGVSYQPVVELRNLNCRSTAAFNRDTTEHFATTFGYTSLKALLTVILPNQALAGGSGSTASKPKPNTQTGATLSGYHVNQSPFGVNGGFPVYLQIDYGQNGSFEYTQFLNNQGPISGALPSRNGLSAISRLIQTSAANATIYVTFPAFIASQNGEHTITARADVTNTQVLGRGCTSLVAASQGLLSRAAGLPSSAPVVSTTDWGCINELTPAGARSETNNVLTQTITVGRAQGLLVGVADIRIRLGSTLNTVPFTVNNQSTSTLPGYTYTIRVNGAVVGSGNRTSTLPAGQTDNVSGAVTYTVPSSATTVPLEVCATSALLATTSCAIARVIVSGSITATTECSDGIDNDADSTSDDRDVGCWTDPFDSTTYNPADDSESGIITLNPPLLRLTADRSVVRTNERAGIIYEITAPYAITCTLTGGGINETINHVSGITADNVLSQALQNKQRFTLSCPGFNDGVFQVADSSKTLDIEIIPQVQEV